MKRIVERGGVALLIVLLAFFISGFSFPDFPGHSGDQVNDVILADTDVAEFQDRLNDEELAGSHEVLIYDQQSELVYKHSFESGEEAQKDKKLKLLLRKCDLVLKSEGSALYMLR